MKLDAQHQTDAHVLMRCTHNKMCTCSCDAHTTRRARAHATHTHKKTALLPAAACACSLQLQRAPTSRYLSVQQGEAVLRQQFVSPKPGLGAGMSDVSVDSASDARCGRRFAAAGKQCVLAWISARPSPISPKPAPFSGLACSLIPPSLFQVAPFCDHECSLSQPPILPKGAPQWPSDHESTLLSKQRSSISCLASSPKHSIHPTQSHALSARNTRARNRSPTARSGSTLSSPPCAGAAQAPTGAQVLCALGPEAALRRAPHALAASFH